VSAEPGPARLFYTTGEACLQAGISAHTLRYWERRMNLTFLRSPHGKRMLRQDDIEKLKRVASLLREGYSLKAVPARIRESVQMDLPLGRDMGGHRRFIRKIRAGLDEIISSLGAMGGK